MIDSQSVKGSQVVTAASRGYDAGKKINGRKRFIVVDSLGLPLGVLIVPASRQDRDGARQLLIDWAARFVKTTVEIVRKKDGQKGFQALPRRWVVERTLAWITAHRHLARDYERDPASSATFIHWAMIRTMARRLARGTLVQRWTPRPTTDR